MAHAIIKINSIGGYGTVQSKTQHNIDIILNITKYALLIASGLLILYISARIFPYLFPLFVGMLLAQTACFIASALRRITFRQSWQKHYDGDRLALIIYFIIIIGLVVLLAYLITIGLNELNHFLNSLPGTIKSSDLSARVSNYLEGIDDPRLKKTILETIEQLNQDWSVKITGFASRLLNAIGNFMNAVPMLILVTIISLMCGFYSISGSRKIYASALRLTGNKILVRRIFRLISEVNSTLFRIIGGYILLMFITFFESWLGFYLLNIPNALTWAIVTALIDLLPILGVMAVILPMSFYFFLSGAFLTGFELLVMLAILTVLRRLWEPLILGSVTRMNPLMTIFSMIIGIWFWGLSGAIWGPIYFVTFFQFLRIFNIKEKIQEYFMKKNLPAAS